MKNKLKILTFYSTVIAILLVSITLGSKVVTVWSEEQSFERKHCVVIDPGHGGEDGGAVSPLGLAESAYNLEISFRLNDLLNLLGHDTKMVRKSDVSIHTQGETLSQKKASDLKERVKLINETTNAVLLSIHQNHYPDDRYSGAQVFYAQTAGSEALAKQLQSAFVSTVNTGSHRLAKKSSGIYLMEHIRCPGVLIECGFLSNPVENEMLKDPEYQKKLCSVIAVTTCQYLSNT